MRRLFWLCSFVFCIGIAAFARYWHPVEYLFVAIAPLLLIGLLDSFQTAHSLQRNFPLFAHMRYIMEALRPGINQYFVESNKDGVPFDREHRSIVYQRSKKQLDTLPFGTQSHVYQEGYEWINHSLAPTAMPDEPPRVTIGGPACQKPYAASLLNVSAMSYGALSANAIMALNGGAKLGHFYHNTGEGGVSPHHLLPGGDLVWQLGTGYFGCRAPDGTFDADKFAARAQHPNIKMIEIKLSQGAKPGHGGILPASKLTQEIIQIRGVVPGKDVISPPAHSAFHTPLELIAYIETLRQLSGGKPVGFKLCIGRLGEFLAIAKAMLQADNGPDFITVDGAEGGTGAAPLEFSNSVGTPLKEGLSFVHNTLVGIGMRERVKVVAAGKVVTGFDMARNIALGADVQNCARAMMFALGCIQALRCNANSCPTGVATQDPALTAGLVVSDKAIRVANFQRETVHSLLDVSGAAGVEHPCDITPWHIMRRTSGSEVKSYAEIYPVLTQNVLLQAPESTPWASKWQAARAGTFTPQR
jgi:glutamate synthase domain-containing protein 2